MKIKFTLAFFILGFSHFACAQENRSPVCPANPSWKLNPAVSDEFIGPVLDKDKWWDFNKTMHDRKPAYFSRDNVLVDQGLLELWAKALKPEERLLSYRPECHIRY